MSLYPHLGAFESTHIFGSGEDILSTTRHIDRWKHDLELLYNSGIRQLRYPAPWHRVESVRGIYDWSWLDGPMQYMEALGLQPIIDPLHHTSFPAWLEHGFAHPEFPDLYAGYVAAFAERYPWLTSYTLFNEPLPTTLFCSYTGVWYPHRRSDREFVQMAVQAGRAICNISWHLRSRNSRVRFIHVDTCEHHSALDRKSENMARFANERRFLIHDLVLGRMAREHPLYSYLAQNGFSSDDAKWFEDHPAPMDVVGLDYYCHSEMNWAWSSSQKLAEMRLPCKRPRGFAAVANDYIERFRKPVMLSETNIRGTVRDRLTWLKFMEEQCEELMLQGADFRGFCWYPSIDSTDWSNLCTRCTRSIDPQGIWYLSDDCWQRHSSELSQAYSLLAQGRIRAKDLPAYRLQPPLDEQLKPYLALVPQWEFQDPSEATKAA